MGKSSHNERRNDEDEALSLCDLPLKILRSDDEPVNNDAGEDQRTHPNDEIVGEEFNFIGPSSSSFESEMCVADEIFFQGQILPLQRLSSFSADGISSISRQHPTCCSSGEYYYYSTSRSTSSSRSNISSRSNSINSTISTTVTTNYSTKSKLKVFNQFHTHPSPKPQIKLSSIRPGPAATTGIHARRQNSSIWEFLRVGLVRTPEIELHNLKLRTNKKNASVNVNTGNGRSSSSSSSNNNSSYSKLNKHKRLDGSSSILSGCGGKCAVDVVEKTVASRSRKVVLMKSKSSGSRIATEDTKEKLLQHNSTDRTFEWLKHLSVENTEDRL